MLGFKKFYVVEYSSNSTYFNNIEFTQINSNT